MLNFLNVGLCFSQKILSHYDFKLLLSSISFGDSDYLGMKPCIIFYFSEFLFYVLASSSLCCMLNFSDMASRELFITSIVLNLLFNPLTEVFVPQLCLQVQSSILFFFWSVWSVSEISCSLLIFLGFHLVLQWAQNSWGQEECYLSFSFLASNRVAELFFFCFLSLVGSETKMPLVKFLKKCVTKKCAALWQHLQSPTARVDICAG